MTKAMRIVLVCFCMFSSRALLRAQPTYTSTATACISSFYDSKNYNWLAYANNCTDRVNVTWVSRNGKNGGGLEIPHGSSRNIGFSEREVSNMGGVEAYACPEHYDPVDANDRHITRPVTEFRCKYRGN
jgi:hypothetical protein